MTKEEFFDLLKNQIYSHPKNVKKWMLERGFMEEADGDLRMTENGFLKLLTFEFSGFYLNLEFPYNARSWMSSVDNGHNFHRHDVMQALNNLYQIYKDCKDD